MRAIVIGGLTAAALLVVGCGGSNGGSMAFSCDQGSGGAHVCTDLVLTGADINQAKTDCAVAKGGTVGTECARTGALGGCKLAFTGYGGTGFTTTWNFSGTASTLMNQCTTLSGVWVTP